MKYFSQLLYLLRTFLKLPACVFAATLLLAPSILFAQGNSVREETLVLPSAISPEPKVYVIQKSLLANMQLPRNYMLVESSPGTRVTIWEFPSYLTANEQTTPTSAGEKGKTPQESKETQLTGNAALIANALKAAGLDPKISTFYELTKGMINKVSKGPDQQTEQGKQ